MFGKVVVKAQCFCTKECANNENRTSSDVSSLLKHFNMPVSPPGGIVTQHVVDMESKHLRTWVFSGNLLSIVYILKSLCLNHLMWCLCYYF